MPPSQSTATRFELNLATVEPSMAGPRGRRRVGLREVPSSLPKALPTLLKRSRPAVKRRSVDGGRERWPGGTTRRARHTRR